VNLIRAAEGCASLGTHHRPYDGLPGIKVGLAAGLQEMGQRTARLTSGLQTMLEDAQQLELPELYRKLLADYYQDRIQETSRRMDELRQKAGAQTIDQMNDARR
jgi:hypothetical protein